jgi:hypothetical protein
LILGYVGSLVTEWRREQRVDERERAAREAEFQRPTLLALQETLHRLLRTEALINKAVDLEHEKSGTPWAEVRWPEDLAEADRLARSEAYMLRVRVKDDQARELAQEIMEGIDIILAGSFVQAFAVLNVGFETFNRLNDRVGELLRTTY